MPDTIDWIGDVAIGILIEGGGSIAFSLQEGQRVPEQFKVGDSVEIVNHPAHPALIAMGHNRGYYEITHIKSGISIRTLHKNDEWRLEK